MIIDGDCLAKGTPNDRGKLQTAVTELIAVLGMRQLSIMSVTVPKAIEKLGAVPFEDEGGVSVCSVLSTSHVAIHTWPLRKVFSMDVFSCRDFEPSSVLAWCKSNLGSTVLKQSNWKR
jgi:S-adenosylmethionine/arginine decarboxylase-like enzyme